MSEELFPPKPAVFLRTYLFLFGMGDPEIGIRIWGSFSPSPAFWGISFLFKLCKQIMDSRIPEAPSIWPWIALVELTQGGSLAKSRSMAEASAKSFWGEPVP